MTSSRTPQEWSDLVDQVLRGDEAALFQFAGEVGMILDGFLIANGMSPADAEVLAVSCTSDIVMSLDRYDEQGQFEAWMFQVVRNQRAGEFRRRPELVQLIESDWLTLYDGEQNEPDDQIYQNNGQLSLPVHQALEHELSKLSESDRRLIVGRHARDQVSFDDLGQELGLTEVNARVRFHRVTKKLETALLTDVRIQNWLGGTSSVSPSTRTLSNEES